MEKTHSSATALPLSSVSQLNRQLWQYLTWYSWSWEANISLAIVVVIQALFGKMPLKRGPIWPVEIVHTKKFDIITFAFVTLFWKSKSFLLKKKIFFCTVINHIASIKSSFMSEVGSLYLNPIQDGPFRGYSRMGGKKDPHPKICQTYSIMIKLGTVIPYLKKTQKICEPRDTPIEFCWISIFSSEISKFCYIRKYRYRLHFGT